jgi:hypothetical protein
MNFKQMTEGVSRRALIKRMNVMAEMSVTAELVLRCPQNTATSLMTTASAGFPREEA